MPTRCPNVRCAQPGHFDSAAHLLKCYGLSLDSNEEEMIVEFLVRMATMASVPNPGRPTPAGSLFEMELHLEEDLKGEGVLSWDPVEVMAALGWRVDDGQGGLPVAGPPHSNPTSDPVDAEHWRLLEG